MCFDRSMHVLAPGLIVLIGLLIYANSFNVPILFDDEPSILKNPSIRSLLPLWKPLFSPTEHDYTVSGRPVANYSLALNYAISGTETWSYHAFNVTVHLLAAMTLYGLVRRTLLLPPQSATYGATAAVWALVVALIWLAHPLQTAAVTYIVQRVESLAALFYLLTLYCFARGSSSRRPLPWFAASVACCALGMGTKEMMVSAPLAVLLYDRQFVSGSFREALRARLPAYLGLAATWAVLAVLVFSGPRLSTVSELIISPLDYLKTQAWAVMHYLNLAIWPHPLIFDYGQVVFGVPILRSVGEFGPSAAMVMGFLTATLAGLWLRHWLGFLGACFFMILAPSSSIIPVLAEPVAEHRMYLPLAAVVVAAVFGTSEIARQRFAPDEMSYSAGKIIRGLRAIFVIALVSIFGWLTFDRNRDYHTEVSIWSDTAAKHPVNARAHFNLAMALEKVGRVDEEIRHYQECIRLHPHNPIAHFHLGNVYARLREYDEAIKCYNEALRLNPDYHDARHNLDLALRLRNRPR